MCNDILKKIRSVDYYEDDVVHDCLSLQIKIVEICSKFLAYLNRNEVVEMSESEKIFSEELYGKSVCVGLTKLFRRAMDITIIKNDNGNREEYKDEYLFSEWGEISFDFE